MKNKFSVPEYLLGQNAVLKLGTLTDSDETYVNGVFVGETGSVSYTHLDVYKRQM